MLVDELLDGGDRRLLRAGVVHFGEAVFGDLLRGGENARLAQLGGRRRHFRIDQVHRAVDEDAGRIAGRIAQKPSALGIRRRGGDSGGAHGGGVGDAGVSVDAADPDRMIGDGGIERRGGRELLVGPAVLIPAAAEDPFARRGALRALAHARDRPRRTSARR